MPPTFALMGLVTVTAGMLLYLEYCQALVGNMPDNGNEDTIGTPSVEER